jgi:hypothetical protein
MNERIPIGTRVRHIADHILDGLLFLDSEAHVRFMEDPDPTPGLYGIGVVIADDGSDFMPYKVNFTGEEAWNGYAEEAVYMMASELEALP